MQILKNHTVNFGAVHYQLVCPSQFRNFRSRYCASYPLELCDITNVVFEWPRLPEIINKFTYEVVRRTHVGTLSTLFKINTQIINRFTFITHLFMRYEV